MFNLCKMLLLFHLGFWNVFNTDVFLMGVLHESVTAILRRHIRPGNLISKSTIKFIIAVNNFVFVL